MDWIVFWTAAVTAGAALAGYGLTYLNNVRLSQREQALARVGRQLGDLYGPLLALVESNGRIFAEFARRYARPGGVSPFADAKSATEEEAADYRLWFATVFMPANRQLHSLLQRNAHLLIEDEVPESLLQLSAHVVGYEIVLKRWERGDYSEHVSVIPFPGASLLDYARTSFKTLKAYQNRLLSTAQPRR